MSLARIDHGTALPALLPGYMRRTRWLALAAAFARQIQQVEDMWQALLASNILATATGAALDQLGAIVRQPRGGALDEPYRRRILAKIAANRSFGLVEDIVKLARLVVDDPGVAVSLQNEGVASYILALSGDAVTDDTAADLAAFMRKATSTGVRGVLEYATVEDDDAFTLDGPAGLPFVTVPTIDLGALPFASGINTVIGIRPEWLDADGHNDDAFTINFITSATESLSDVAPDFEVFFKSGSSTIASVEALINTSQYLFVVEASTVGGNMASGSGDELGPYSVVQVNGTAGGAFATARE